jgi:hypothetical protein
MRVWRGGGGGGWTLGVLCGMVWAGVWTSGWSGGLARRRPGFESSAGTASLHLDVYHQRREHSWDGYMRYIKFII